MVLDWQKRSIQLVGSAKSKRLWQAHVILFGLGGVGSFVAEALVRSGLGCLSLVEYDRIAATNINRQLPALSSTIGMPKIEVVADRLSDINPDADLRLFPIQMDRSNLPGILDAAGALPDFIADAIDDVQAKTRLIVTAYEKGIPIISSMGAGFRLDPSKLRIGDIRETHTCPLARVIRKNLRDEGIDKGVPVVWSIEQPIQKPVGDEAVDEQTCSAYEGRTSPASMIFVPAAAGLLMASYIIRQL